MVVSITKSISYVSKAIPIVKLTSDIVSDGILNCLEVLNESHFSPRAVSYDNHQTFKHLMNSFILPTKIIVCPIQIPHE